MAEELRSYHKPQYYVVREIFVDIDDKGNENVVIDVQGVREDGSYWVSGFQIYLPRIVWDNMNEDEIKRLIDAEVEKHEIILDEYFEKVKRAEMETRALRDGNKYQRIVNYRVEAVGMENV